MAATRFVILHHVHSDSEHWDLMLEHAGALLTWQLPLAALTEASLPLSARRIGDHRTAYLEYEGELTGGRGRVSRVDRGLLVWKHMTPTRVEFALEGEGSRGNFVLEQVDEAGVWELRTALSPD